MKKFVITCMVVWLLAQGLLLASCSRDSQSTERPAPAPPPTTDPGDPPTGPVPPLCMDASLVITPPALVVPAGTTHSLQVHCEKENRRLMDVTQLVTWSVRENNTVTISKTGELKALKEGETVVTADFHHLDATMHVEVQPAVLEDIELQPANATIHEGEQLQFTATGLLSDGKAMDMTQQVHWQTEAGHVATINPQGLLTFVAPGQTRVLAEYPSMAITPADITASQADIIRLELIPAGMTLGIEGRETLVAKATYSDQTTREISDGISWTSVNQGVATVDEGIVTGHSKGTSTIEASIGAHSAFCAVSVLDLPPASLRLEPEALVLPTGVSESVRVFIKYINGPEKEMTHTAIFNTQDPAIADVTAEGWVTGQKDGKTSLTVTCQGLKGLIPVEVTHSPLVRLVLLPRPTNSLFVGQHIAMKAMGIYHGGECIDLTRQVFWRSLQPDILGITASGTEAGQAIAYARGNATLEVSYRDLPYPATETWQIEEPVVLAIRLSPENPLIPKNTTITLSAFAAFSDGVERNISNETIFRSDNPGIAEVGAKSGEVTAREAGRTTLVHADYREQTGSTMVTVTDPSRVESLTIHPQDITMFPGGLRLFHATAKFVDGSELDVTRDVFWRSTNPLAVWILDIPMMEGFAYGLIPGLTAKIKTSYEGKQAEAMVRVSLFPVGEEGQHGSVLEY